MSRFRPGDIVRIRAHVLHHAGREAVVDEICDWEGKRPDVLGVSWPGVTGPLGFDVDEVDLVYRPVRLGDEIRHLTYKTIVTARAESMREAASDPRYFENFEHLDGTPTVPPLSPRPARSCDECGVGLDAPRTVFVTHSDGRGTFCSVRCAEGETLPVRVPVTLGEADRALAQMNEAIERAARRVDRHPDGAFERAIADWAKAARSWSLARATGADLARLANLHGIHRSNLTALSKSVAILVADIYALGVEAWPLWRTDPEVIAMVELVADHRVGGRISNGRLGRAFVLAWRRDDGGFRTIWMKRALEARAWRRSR